MIKPKPSDTSKYKDKFFAPIPHGVNPMLDESINAVPNALPKTAIDNCQNLLIISPYLFFKII